MVTVPKDVRAEGGEPLIVSGDTTQPQPTNPPADPPASTTPPEPAAPPVDPAAIAAMIAEQVAAQMAEQHAAETAAVQQAAIAAYLEANPPGRPAPSNTPPPANSTAGDPQAGADGSPRRPEAPIPTGGQPAKPIKYAGLVEVSAAWNDASETVKALLGTRGTHAIDFRVDPMAVRAQTLYDDVEAAVLVDIGPVQVRDRTRVAVTPIPRAIDYMAMRPVVGSTVVVPVMQDATAAGGGASTSAGRTAAQAPVRQLQHLGEPTQNQGGGVELTILVPAYLYPVQNLIVNHPVPKALIEDDPTIVGAETRRLLRLGMQVLDHQVLGGGAAMNFETGAYTPATGNSVNDLVGLTTLAGTRSVQVPADSTETAESDQLRENQRDQNVLDAPTVGVEAIISTILAQAMPTLGIFDGSTWQKLWSSLRGNYFPVAGMTQRMIDYMGVSFVLDQLGPGNTGFVGDFQEENQFIAMRRDFRVEMSDDYAFGDDNMTFKLTMRAANCIANPNALIEVRDTNRYKVRVPNYLPAS